MKKKLPLNLVRTVKFWIRYNPKRREIVQQSTYKHQLPKPSASSGDVLIEVKGFYVPTGAPRE